MNHKPLLLRLLPSAVLILSCSWLLLWSDRERTTTNHDGLRRIALAYYGPETTVEQCIAGLLEGLSELGLEQPGKLQVQRMHAQGEVSQITPMLQSLDASDAELIVTFSTPVLASACTQVRHKPIVLTYCFDPIAAGAGRSYEDHLPQVTGIGSMPPLERLLSTLVSMTPPRQRVGVLYNASEANSSRRVQAARGALQARGMILEELTIGSSAEVWLAAQALVARRVDCFWAVGDNTLVQGIEALLRCAREARIPVLADDPTHVERGALLGIGVAFHELGRRTAPIVARVLAGERPQQIPIQRLELVDVAWNPALARELGLQIPEKEVADARVVEIGALR